MNVRFERFSTPAPVLQNSGIASACYDMSAARCVVLEPGATRLTEKNIDFCFSEKYVAEIYPCLRISSKWVFN